jgi:hypothetical protein
VKVTGEAHLDATVDCAAGAKVGAKGQAHFVVLQSDSGPAEAPPARTGRPLMAIPGKRRR